MKGEFRKVMFTALTVLSLLTLCGQAGAQNIPPAAEWIPESAVITIEILESSRIVDAVLSDELRRWVSELPQVAAFMESPQFAQMVGIGRYLEFRLGTDWRTAVDRLLGGSILLAAFPRDRVLAVVDTKSEELLQKLHAVVLEHAQDEARKAGDPDRVTSGSYKGWTGWTLDGGKSAYALAGARLFWANNPDLLRSVVDVHEAAGVGSLARQESYRQAVASLPSDAVARAFVNVGFLKQVPRADRAANALQQNPLLTLLAADLPAAIEASTWLGAAVRVGGGRAQLDIVSDGKFPGSDHPAAFSLPDETAGCFVNIEVPRRIFAASFYRDLARFYSAKDSLFPERTSGLIFFENMMGVFFTGRHFSQEVLPHLAPEIRLVVAAQEYDPNYGVPAVALPAIAVVFRMNDPARFVPMAEEAWQKALGLINFTRGQQALPGLLLDRGEYQGVRYYVSKFSTVGLSETERSDIRFNFSPVLAACGEHLILSTTEQLARDIIDFLRDKARAEVRLPGRSLVAELDRAGLVHILEVNRETLIRQNMVEKGHGRSQAEQEVAGLLLLARLLGQQRLEVIREKDSPRARLTVQLPL